MSGAVEFVNVHDGPPHGDCFPQPPSAVAPRTAILPNTYEIPLLNPPPRPPNLNP